MDQISRRPMPQPMAPTTPPIGSLYSRTDGAVGSTLYVRGASAWAAVAGV